MPSEEKLNAGLAFGDSCATVLRDRNEFAARFERAHAGLQSLVIAPTSRPFEVRWCEVRMPDLVAVAFERPPMIIERLEESGFTLWLPTHGTALIESGGARRQVGEGIGFALDTCRHRLVKAEETGGILFSLDRARLTRTRDALLGNAPVEGGLWNEERLHFLPADDPAYPLALFCDSMRGVLDAVAHKPALAERTTIHDGLYRMVAWILTSISERSEAATRRGQTNRRHLQNLCDFIDAHLTDHLTLTELETVSGLSARVLQLHFRKNFGMTPMEWVRNRRLDVARARLLGGSDVMITALSYELGFSSPSHFAAYYQRRFGELPSRVRPRGDQRS